MAREIVSWWTPGGWKLWYEPAGQGDGVESVAPRRLASVEGAGDPPELRALVDRHPEQGWLRVMLRGDGRNDFMVAFYVEPEHRDAFLASHWLAMRLSILAQRPEEMGR